MLFFAYYQVIGTQDVIKKAERKLITYKKFITLDYRNLVFKTIGGKMNSKSIEKMKELIEEKKKRGNNSKNNKKANKVIGRASKVMGREASKGVKVGNGGGLFDK